jgi:alkaline phosphatase D
MRILITALIAPAALTAADPVVVAFGSCLRQDRPAPALEAAVARPRDLWLFLGDNAYLDTADPARLAAGWRQFLARPDVRTLLAGPVTATWDDHDYGRNDGGADWAGKVAARTAFCDAFAIPADDPRRTRPDGIYQERIVARDGITVQVLVLDTRWNRSPLRRRGDPPARGQGVYLPQPDDAPQQMLGEAQWRWLEDRLRTPATARIIASSIQVVADGHGWETWGNLPAERRRLWRAIAASGTAPVVVVSGDRHFGELSRLDPAADGPDRPLWDLTSSALNQTAPDEARPNPLRIGAPVLDPNSGEVAVAAGGTVTLRLLGPEGRVRLVQALPGPGSEAP